MFSAKIRKLEQRNPLANDALAIWSAGTARVLPQNVIPGSIEVTADGLRVAGRLLPASKFSQVYVFGAGKAGAAMAVEVEKTLVDSRYWGALRGSVNVPDDPSGLPQTRKIKLETARPAGHNLPTLAARDATRRMLGDLETLDEATIALGLFSGGGSALLVCPRDGIEFEQLLAVTQFLQNAGATIHELNAVRSWLCQVKAGGLAHLCTAGRIETLIISDVVGDDLSVIASGPCHSSSVSAQQAYDIFKHFIDDAHDDISADLHAAQEVVRQLASDDQQHPALGDHVRNNLIATNGTALAAAEQKADQLGYRVVSRGSANQGDAYSGGRQFANFCQELRELGGRWCVTSGGEPTLAVNPHRPAGCRGGRNQAWALAALDELWQVRGCDLTGLAILSGGTDGEDGPCDVAGAVVTQEVLESARAKTLTPVDYLRHNNEYAFFASTTGHLDTAGHTHTNVSDLRVACIAASRKSLAADGNTRD
jgi:glycerate-2-kinase